MSTEWERFSFNAAAIPKGKGLSRARMNKLRKQSSLGSKPSPFSLTEPPLQEDFDRLTIQGNPPALQFLREGFSNLDINALPDEPFVFGTTFNHVNLNSKNPVETVNDPVSCTYTDSSDSLGDTSLNEEMKKMEIKESIDISEEMGKMDIRESGKEIGLNESMRRLNVKESAGNIDGRDADVAMKLTDEEGTPERFVFTGSQFAMADKPPLDQTAVSKPTRVKHKKKGSKQKVHLWSAFDFPSPETKSEDSFSPMDISPSPAPENHETEHVVETGTAFAFGGTQNSQPILKKFQQNVESGVEECEKWRLKGNMAYKAGDLLAAEEYYKEGLKSLSKEESPRSCLRALVLCYSNLAATHMSLGRLRDALGDCQEAASIDSSFYKVHLRAATCHLLMGQAEEAAEHFRKCLSGSDVCVDRKIAVEASEGLLKAEKFMKLCAEAGDNSDREAALEAAGDALVISPYCEKMLETKAELLFSMRRYDVVVSFLQISLDSAEMNSPPGDLSYRHWRFRLAFLSYFHIGKLEDALSLNESGKYGTIDGPTSSLVSTARDLLRYKAAGNEAMQAGKALEAIEHYTSALALNTESRPFAAICFFNRAAAHKSLGNVIDAIADCNLAIALDGSYDKALSRRATLYEMIRDYNEAASDLRRVLSSSADRSRLLSIEEESRKDVPLDLYMILGIDMCASNAEIKKAYRKAALRHHPDKAGQVLARSEESAWREIGEEVRENAEKLFKRIGEAYAVLCDPVKRFQYDQEEEIRVVGKNRNPTERKDLRRPYA